MEHLYHIHSDGSGILNLTNNIGINHEPQLSPDESEIVFTSYRDLEDGLFMMVRDTLF
jgi:Tol biopolymer transport system component